MQVVLDCNIYISIALGSSRLKALSTAWQAGQFRPLMSSYLLSEIKTVLERDKFAPYIHKDDIPSFLTIVERLTEAMLPRQPFPEFSDPKDRYLLAMLRDSGASILVTGDQTLLDLGRYENKLILHPLAFVKDYLERAD